VGRVGASGSLDDHVYDRLMRERILVLGTEVRDDIANVLSAQMLLLSAASPEKDIWLYINSPGGSVTAGLDLRHDAFCAMRRRHRRDGPGRIEADSDRDSWFTAGEAKDYGFVDHVIVNAAALPRGDGFGDAGQ
jgi:ATP-dependent protease ClpP protease subunit